MTLPLYEGWCKQLVSCQCPRLVHSSSVSAGCLGWLLHHSSQREAKVPILLPSCRSALLP